MIPYLNNTHLSLINQTQINYEINIIDIDCIYSHLIGAGFTYKEGSDPNSAKKYLVSDLPGLHENITPDNSIPLMFAGQLEIYPETDTHYFSGNSVI